MTNFKRSLLLLFIFLSLSSYSLKAQEGPCIFTYELDVNDNDELVLTTYGTFGCDSDGDGSFLIDFLFTFQYADGVEQEINLPIEWERLGIVTSWYTSNQIYSYVVDNCYDLSELLAINVEAHIIYDNALSDVLSNKLVIQNSFISNITSTNPSTLDCLTTIQINEVGVGDILPEYCLNSDGDVLSYDMTNESISTCIPDLNVEIIQYDNCNTSYFPPQIAYPFIYGGTEPYNLEWFVNGSSVAAMEVIDDYFGDEVIANIIDGEQYSNDIITLEVTDDSGQSVAVDFNFSEPMSEFNNLDIYSLFPPECGFITDAVGNCYANLVLNYEYLETTLGLTNLDLFPPYVTFTNASGELITYDSYFNGLLQVPHDVNFTIIFESLTSVCESTPYEYTALNCSFPIPDLQWNCGADNVIELFINEDWLIDNDNYTWFVWEHDPLGPLAPYVISEGPESFFDIDIVNSDNSGIYKVTAYTFQNGIASCKSMVEFVVPVMNEYIFNENPCSYTVGVLSPDSGYSLGDIIGPSFVGTLSNGEVASISDASAISPLPGTDYGLINFGQVYGDSQEDITYSLPILVNGEVCNISSAPLDVEPLIFTSASELETDIVISSGTEEEWLEPKYLGGTLTIESGASLTIMNGVEFFDQNAGILVEAGGSLYIEGSQAVLRSRGCGFPSNEEWLGITIEGVSFSEMNDLSNLGLVSVSSGATIRDAKIAIQDELHTIFDPNSLADWDIGGAKIQLDNANFVNNRVAVKMHSFDYQYDDGEEESYIRNCVFDNQDEFLSGEDYDSHIILDGVKNMTPIYGNTFKTSSTDLAEQEKGTAIRLYHSNVDIGLEVSFCNCDDNIFQNMYEGIEAYSLGGINSSVHIWNNFFNDNTKAVSINSSTFLTIKDNEFHIPAGQSTDENDTYGIWIGGSKTFEISNNSFDTDADNNLDTRGLIINESGLGPRVVGNYFDGNFTEGTTFELNNTELTLNCNGYNDCQTDWFLETDSELGEQGEGCDDEEFPMLSFNNTWSSQSDAINIDNQSSFDLTLNHDSSFDDLVLGEESNDVFSESCTDDLNVNCVGFQFPWMQNPTEPATENPCGYFLMVLNTDDLNNASDASISQLTYQLIRNGETDKAFQLLDCTDRSWSNRLLVTSYLQIRDLDSSEYYLQRLNTETAEDLAFYDFYSTLIEGMRNGGTGKKQGDREKLMANSQQAQWPYFKTMNESALAIYFNENYNRTVSRKRINVSKEEPKLTNFFTISPNPTEERAAIDLLQEIEKNSSVQLYDLSGNLIKEYEVQGMTTELNLSDLEGGIYFCRLMTHTRILDTQKLIVID